MWIEGCNRSAKRHLSRLQPPDGPGRRRVLQVRALARVVLNHGVGSEMRLPVARARVRDHAAGDRGAVHFQPAGDVPALDLFLQDLEETALLPAVREPDLLALAHAGAGDGEL